MERPPAWQTRGDQSREHSGPRGTAFRLFLAAGFTSLTGDGIRVAALPLFTAWSTRSPLAVSAVATAELVPWLLVALPAGALVDRWSPRPVVIGSHAIRAVVAATLAMAVFTHHATVPVLVVIAFVLTCGETFTDSAYQLLLVEFAGRDRLSRANSWYVTAETIGLDLAGPLLAAVLFAWQPAACFTVNAAAYALSAVLVSGLPDAGQAKDAERVREPASMRQQLVAGGRFLFRERRLRTLVLAVVVAALAVSAANAIVSLYAVQTLAIRAALVPTLWMAQAVGTLVATRLTVPLVGRFGDGRVMVGALALLGGGFAMIGAIPVAAAAWAAYVLVGAGAGTWNVLSATRRQLLTPTPLMGRVTSTYRMLAWGLMPLGAALAGPLAEITSLGTVFLVVAGLVGLVAVTLARSLVRDGR